MKYIESQSAVEMTADDIRNMMLGALARLQKGKEVDVRFVWQKNIYRLCVDQNSLTVRKEKE